MYGLILRITSCAAILGALEVGTDIHKSTSVVDLYECMGVSHAPRLGYIHPFTDFIHPSVCLRSAGRQFTHIHMYIPDSSGSYYARGLQATVD